ncbi:MAG TPA: protein translocase subunit SecD [Clostridiales bacterium]|nr:protein translocase subunit SecD [Clostridiales bacterium]
MKSNGRLKLILISALVICAVVLSVYFVKEFPNLLKLGLDLQGGVSVTLQAEPEDGEKVSPDDLKNLTDIMTKRVDEFGVAEPLIQIEGEDRIIVELAGLSDIEEAVEMLGTTAKLEFQDPNGDVILDGTDLKNAYVTQSGTGTYEVALEFSSAGKEAFAAATTEFVNQPISIILDEKEISSPNVDEPIKDGKAVISGIGDYDKCAELASLLRGGALPVDVKVIEERVVGPQLGSDSLQKSYVAIIYGVAAIFLFMIVYYKLPGLLTCISLLLYGIIVFWLQCAINVTWTLPGIAGFLLSLGMAVDANIIIFERLKDELRKGRSMSAAMSAGFRRAMNAIIDSNVTTLIATTVLFFFGVSSIKGFAVTLSIGIVVSMFTAIVFTRYLLKFCTNDPLLSKRSLYRS